MQQQKDVNAPNSYLVDFFVYLFIYVEAVWIKNTQPKWHWQIWTAVQGRMLHEDGYSEGWFQSLWPCSNCPARA